MPRDIITKIYSPPEGTYGEPDTDILSASHNAWLDDMALEFSSPLPIEMGGTGAPSVDMALENIGGASVFYLTTLLGGAIVWFAHNRFDPAQFLICDGRAISRTQYRTLFQRFGTLFGAGNGSSTFNLPDLRGEFIRGLDAGRGVDADRILGSLQAGANKEHTHTGTVNSAGNHSHTVPNQAIFAGGSGVQAGSNFRRNPNTGFPLPINSAGNHSHTVTAIQTGVEMRPKNVALIATIKA